MVLKKFDTEFGQVRAESQEEVDLLVKKQGGDVVKAPKEKKEEKKVDNK
jgi:hypothetical protein